MGHMQLSACTAMLRFLMIALSSSATIAASEHSLTRRHANYSQIVPPLSFAPSQYWDGNDGQWSTFAVRIGSSEQAIRVLPSTATYSIWAVGPDGCPSTYPATCPGSRGGLYNANDSHTWSQITTLDLDNEQNLGFSTPATLGTDQVTLGWPGSNGQEVSRAPVVYYEDASDFFVGMFGLNPAVSNASGGYASSDYGGLQSYLSGLRNQTLIPSLSYGYTAGNIYRFDKVLGSLTFGGYDAARIALPNVTYVMNADLSRDLQVTIQKVHLSGDGLGQASYTTSFAAAVDSTIPYLYLPLDLCQVFEQTFGLVYNSSLDLYTVNSTLHTTLLKANPSVTFTLGQSYAGGNTVDITLPYGAFDLSVSYPIIENTTQKVPYFPIRRATNATQFTMGRTFLQEAYLIADYERQNFTIAPCAWDTNINNAQLEAITSPLTLAALDKSSHSTSHTKLIIGVVVGGVLIIAILIAYALFRRHMRRVRIERERDRKRREDQATMPRPELEEDDNMIYPEMPGESAMYEMEQQDRAQELEGGELAYAKELPGEGYVAHAKYAPPHVAREARGGAGEVYELDGTPVDERRASAVDFRSPYALKTGHEKQIVSPISPFSDTLGYDVQLPPD
ncbi:hypothetical protein ANO11243_058380 [Dothideomycetidae sp. 11243]|nr:hypothetical protein ANO11243_058380 [fungal sp. No.11243]